MEETAATATAAIHERPLSHGVPSDTSGVRAGLDDPQLLQVLTSEHLSLLTSRSLAYNEAFTRAAMFLTFLSMSFVALALVGPPLSFGRDFLVIAVTAVTFDAVIGLLTFIRVGGCNGEDFRTMHAMNRIRHGYVQVVPRAAGYFVSGTFDDPASVAASYNPSGQVSAVGNFAYGLSTSMGMVGLIVALVNGILGALITLLFDARWPLPLLVGIVAAVATFVSCVIYTFRGVAREQASLTVAFPRDPDAPPQG